MRVLVTGGAGSIGVFVVRALLARGDAVTIVDSFNDFYDPALKRARLSTVLSGLPAPQVMEGDVADPETLSRVFADARPEKVIHLAAWAAVRPSVEHPLLYTKENVDGAVNVFERSREHNVQNVVFASSSSVYARGTPAPFREDERCDTPIAPYGASKRAGELYGWMYHYLHGLPVICLRFFTVYGPWIRPDMATWKFTEKIHRGEPITLHRQSADGAEVRRDFTYIDDIVRGIVAALDRNTTFDILNLGGDDPVPLLRFVRAIETGLKKTAVIHEKTLPAEEAIVTAADISRAREKLDYEPAISLEEGTRRFTDWYLREFLPAFPRGLVPSRYWS